MPFAFFIGIVYFFVFFLFYFYPFIASVALSFSSFICICVCSYPSLLLFFNLRDLYHGLWLTIDFNTFVLWWGWGRGEERTEGGLSCGKSRGVIRGVYFMVDRLSFCTGSVWSLFFRCWGEDSVDVIETLSLRNLCSLHLCICEVKCRNLIISL